MTMNNHNINSKFFFFFFFFFCIVCIVEIMKETACVACDLFIFCYTYALGGNVYAYLMFCDWCECLFARNAIMFTKSDFSRSCMGFLTLMLQVGLDIELANKNITANLIRWFKNGISGVYREIPILVPGINLFLLKNKNYLLVFLIE